MAQQNDNPQQNDDTPIWGGAEIARAAGLADRAQVYPLLNSGVLPGRKVGRRWVSTPSQLRAALQSGGRDG